MIRNTLAGLVLCFCTLVWSDATAAERFKPFKLRTPEGETRTLQDLQGKATLVTFFFPTCGYCNAEFPHIARIYETYKAQGLTVVAINIQRDQDRLVPGWKKKHGYQFPVLVGARLESLMDDYDLKATPTNVVLDASGQEVYRRAGYKKTDEQELETRIRETLGLPE